MLGWVVSNFSGGGSPFRRNMEPEIPTPQKGPGTRNSSPPMDRMTEVCENLASLAVGKSICKYYRFSLCRLSEGCAVPSETRKVTNRF